MRQYIFISCCLFFWPSLQAQDNITGLWKTIDDETGEAKSVVRIFEKEGRVHGEIISLFPSPGQPEDPVCDLCPEDDDRYGKKIIGMEIIRGMEKNGPAYSGGTVLKPDEGKIYRCKIWLEGDNLKVRGYWGIFYRTQTWDKLE